MAANTVPVFLLTPKNAFNTTGTTANTDRDGTGSNVTLLLTAGAEGSKVEEVYLTHLGTNIQTVVRFFVNNGSTPSTAANNSLVHEETMYANTAAADGAGIEVTWRPNLVLAAGYRLYVSIGTSIASGIQVTVNYGDY